MAESATRFWSKRFKRWWYVKWLGQYGFGDVFSVQGGSTKVAIDGPWISVNEIV